MTPQFQSGLIRSGAGTPDPRPPQRRWTLQPARHCAGGELTVSPVELKVKSSTAAAAASGLVLWVLGRYVFKGAVPDVIASWVYAIVPAAVTFAAGYAAKHTPRPAAAPAPVAAPEVPHP